jgi:ABC-2 type transport system ATP-binding protein
MDKSNMDIIVQNLSKNFQAVKAVNDISFDVRSGELFGFLGPNGAGKTTTIKMMTGLARPDSGTIITAGIDCSRNPKAAQHLIGVVPDESNLYPELTGHQNLCFCASLYGIGKAEREHEARKLMEAFNLKEAANRKFGGYSKGMKRKLTIAAGIIHKPRVLFLDEPTTGIDVASARALRVLIEDLHKQGTTILLTTHYIEEAQRLCDRIAFIVSGKIVAEDTVHNLLKHDEGKHFLHVSHKGKNADIAERLYARFATMSFSFLKDNTFRVESSEPIIITPIVMCLEEMGIDVSEAKRITPSLEDVFVRITGLEADTMQKDKDKQGRAK